MKIDFTKVRTMFSQVKNGLLYGFVALTISFLLRIGGIGVFPPEVAIERFFAIVPASIQEAGVQSLGEFAKYAGLVVAFVIALLAYGVFGILFQRIGQKIALGNLLEKGLAYSFIPLLFFGLLVLPASNVGVFGASSEPGLYSSVLNLLMSNLVFGAFLGAASRSLGKTQTEEILAGASTTSSSSYPAPSQPRFSAQRRIFIEKTALAVASLGLIGLSLERFFTSSATPLASGQSGSGEIFLDNSSGVPQIFFDPRLSDLIKNEVTPASQFYYVSKNLFDPQVDISNWFLEINGDVSNAVKVSYSDITALSSVEQYTTFECVSNQINGNLISNALWTGVPLASLLQRASYGPNAKYVVFYSADGYSVAIPLSKALESDSILAYKINRIPLPVPHGFPLRAVIPGLYGMMSAKWITQIQVVDSPYDAGYWQTRGWTNVATINTLAFITVPLSVSPTVSRASDGSVILGGVAFAGTRGISKVEVSLDNGSTWRVATLKPPISNETWTLWAYKFYPKPGGFPVIVRATDGGGAIQSSLYAPPFPNGAQGYASLYLTVN